MNTRLGNTWATLLLLWGIAWGSAALAILSPPPEAWAAESAGVEAGGEAGQSAAEGDADGNTADDPAKPVPPAPPAQPALPKLSPSWNLLDGAWYYGKDDGTAQTGWLYEGGSWYWLDPAENGRMATGLFKDDTGTTYCADSSGAMLTGWQWADGAWHYLWGSGAMATGWQWLGGAWYYLHPDSGAMATGWAKVGSAWYYLDGSGAMQTGWLDLGGTWYYLDGSGIMATGWRWVAGAWYYLSPDSGAMATDWVEADGAWYHLDGSGAMQTGWLNLGGTWYYLWGSGAMATGWQWLGGSWYYLYPDSGAMAVNRWIGDYYVAGSGAMATNQWIGPFYVDGTGRWVNSAKRFDIPWAGQPNGSYCGPTSGYMILRYLGANYAIDGTPLTIENVARFMGAGSGGIFMETRDFERGMNWWLGYNAYRTIERPSPETVRDAVVASFETGYPVSVHTWERRGGPHYNGHANSTMGHLMVVDGYDAATDAVYIADPWAGVWSQSSQKFWYPSLDEFTRTYITPLRGIYAH